MNARFVLSFSATLLATAVAAQSDLPQGWYPIGDQGMTKYVLEVGEEFGFYGSGLGVRSVPGERGNFGGVGQAISPENYLGKKVRLTGYVRTFEVTDYAGLWMRVDGANGMIELDNMQDRGVKGTTGWQQYSIVLWVPSNASRLIFGALLNGDGVMHVDELELEIVPDDTPVTGGARSKTPQNMSF